MRTLQSSWFPVFLGVITCFFILEDVLFVSSGKPLVLHHQYREGEEWQPPDESSIPFNKEGDLIRYGQELIVYTALYLGPKGTVARISNGMNCQNCHTYAGTQNFGNPFSAVNSLYPRYRERSGQVESIEYRINDCMQRSLNGQPLDSLSYEMRAMVAYLKWVGKEVPKNVRPKGAGTQTLTFLSRPADPGKGRVVFTSNCQRCHGQNGEGLLSPDSSLYIYPPLWGANSYNTAAGIYRLSQLAGFIKSNMPYGINWKQPLLSDEQAWDVAAYIASQPRPVKHFVNDWRNPAKKPFDYPFGPYVDSFSEQQHKYGPFGAITKQ